MPGDWWQQFANLRLFFLFQWCHPGKKLLFMGCEFGQWSEWYCKTSLDWHLPEQQAQHRQLQGFVKQLNRIYVDNPSLWQVDFSLDGFRWMDFNDVDNSVVGFARFAQDHRDHLICIVNFTPQVLHNYKMGVPSGTQYREILNSDAEVFGGSNVINPEALEPIHEPYGEAPYHITLSLPPLSGVILSPVSEKN